MNFWASKSNSMTPIYIYWIWELGTFGRHAKHTKLRRWTVGHPRATTWPQFTYIGFGNLALWADTLGTPNLTDEMRGIQEQLHDHNSYILDLGIGQFGQTRQAHHIKQMNCWATKSNHMTTIYMCLIWEWGTLGIHAKHHIFQMNCLASKSNYMTKIYIYWIFELGTLGRHTKHTIFSRWSVWRPRATTWPQFKYTWFGNWALWAKTLSTPYLADDIFGVQEELHDHNLSILDLGFGHFGQTR